MTAGGAAGGCAQLVSSAPKYAQSATASARSEPDLVRGMLGIAFVRPEWQRLVGSVEPTIAKRLLTRPARSRSAADGHPVQCGGIALVDALRLISALDGREFLPVQLVGSPSRSRPRAVPGVRGRVSPMRPMVSPLYRTG
jgi:hypothetical protein